MSGKFWSEQFIDDSGAPYSDCYAQFFDEQGQARKAVWLDRAKTSPGTGGTTANVSGDATGRITVYGDGIYKVVVRASGDDGSNAPIATLEGVEMVAAEGEYDGPTSGFTLASLEERMEARQGRVATPTSAQSGTTLDLSKFSAAGGTYLVQGTSSLLTFQKITLEDYAEGARITVECGSYPIKLRAKRAFEGSGYNIDIGGDFLMPVGSSIDLELRGGVWVERARKTYQHGYADIQATGIASAASITVPGDTVLITGTTTINTISWVKSGELAPPGQKLVLIFADAGVVGDMTGNVDLDGTFTGQSGGGSTLVLVSTGTGWNELARKDYVPPNVTQTLPSGNTPSVAGTYEVYYTGSNFDDVKRLASPGTLGRQITICPNGYKDDGTVDDGPTGSYTNSRKVFKHKALITGVLSDGYLDLKGGVDFSSLPGDVIRFQLLMDKDGLLFWKELERVETDITPLIRVASGSTINWWRPNHKIENVSGGDIDTDTISPSAGAHYLLTLYFVAGDAFKWHSTGNCSMQSGGNATMSHAGMAFTFISMDANATGHQWVELDTMPNA